MGFFSDLVNVGARLVAKTIVAGPLGFGEEVVRQVAETSGKVVGLIYTKSDYKGKELSGLKDLRAGDVLVKYDDGSGTNTTIASIQQENPASAYWFVHAALVTDKFSNLHALEMSGEGLVANDLTGHNKGFEYEVFRPKNSRIGETAARLIGDLAVRGQREKSAEYNFLGLTKLIADFDNMVTAEEFNVGYQHMLDGRHDEKYYCSQFVVWLYQGAKYRSGQPDNLWGDISVHIGPPRLAKIMKFNLPQSWEHVGYLAAGKR
ncbi:MAG: hypothetical protein HZC38_18215 [Chloroflexi bacterium]|nr:hypothetical protein [Chloroflexota bacterium]